MLYGPAPLPIDERRQTGNGGSLARDAPETSTSDTGNQAHGPATIRGPATSVTGVPPQLFTPCLQTPCKLFT